MFTDAQLVSQYGPMLDSLFASAGPDVIRARINSYVETYLGNRQALRTRSYHESGLDKVLDGILARFAATPMTRQAVTTAVDPPKRSHVVNLSNPLIPESWGDDDDIFAPSDDAGIDLDNIDDDDGRDDDEQGGLPIDGRVGRRGPRASTWSW